MKKITSEFENETLSLSHPYSFCFVNATIWESDVFNMCGISGALHPNEARVYVPVWQWLEMYNVHNLEFFWPNALCCLDLHISKCKFASLSLSSLSRNKVGCKLFIFDKFLYPLLEETDLRFVKKFTQPDFQTKNFTH